VIEQRKPPKERRKGFVIEEAKFDTQRLVTYALLLIFTATVTNVLLGNDQSERSTILQTVVNFTMIAVGYWLGASKTPNGVAPIAPIAPIAALAPIAPIAPIVTGAIKAEDVKVEAAGDVTVTKDK
jgi:sulfite exporter TauE/SafE